MAPHNSSNGLAPEKVCALIRATVASEGLPLAEFGWLAEALVESGCVPHSEGAAHISRSVLHESVRIWNKEDKNSSFAILTLLLNIKHYVEHQSTPSSHASAADWKISFESLTKLIQVFVTKGFDFRSAFEALFKGAVLKELARREAQFLYEYNVLDPNWYLDVKRFGLYGDGLSSDRCALSDSGFRNERDDIHSPIFWMALGPKVTVKHILPVIQAHDEARFVELSRGFVAAMRHGSTHFDGKDTVGGTGDDHVIPLFGLVDQRIGPKDKVRDASVSLRCLWYELWLYVDRSRLISEDASLNARLCDGVDFDVGRIRPKLRDEPDTVTRTDDWKAFLSAGEVGFRCLPLWDAIRQLLLAFRSLSVPAVAPDLRCIPVTGRNPDPPTPWNKLPATILYMFHGAASKAEETDPELVDLRGEFARFALDRLKTDKAGLPVEKAPEWRIAYIKAAVDLCINPDGRGHRILHHVAENDPDPKVRETAKIAYGELRRGIKVPAGYSVRRPFIDAFWQLRKGHLLALGMPVDEVGANATREEDSRRTTKPKEKSV